MTIAEWAVLAAVLLYLLTVAPVKVHRTFDNANPRDPAFYGSGAASRALGAHLNGIETFPFFAAAVLLAEFRAQPQQWIDILATAFIAIRIAYALAYVFNLPTLRTILWNLGFLVNATIFLMPWWAPGYDGTFGYLVDKALLAVAALLTIMVAVVGAALLVQRLR